jgi:carbon-monoxide dehydrogenase small subunit
MKSIKFILNGDEVETEVRDDMMLLELLREKFSLTGTKEGCGEGECGACTVLVNGLNVDSCLYPAMEIEGKEVVTIEGLSENGELSAIQKSFLENGGVQCGFCTPGMVMSTKAFIDNLNGKGASDEDIKRALSGNLCRCTGYVQIIESVKNLVYDFGDKN